MLKYLRDITVSSNSSINDESALDKNFGFLRQLLPNINYNMMNNDSTRLLELSSSPVDNGQFEIENDSSSSLSRSEIDQLINGQVDESLITAYETYIKEIDKSPPVYYNYHFGVLGEEKIDELDEEQIEYTGKGFRERDLCSTPK